MSSNNYKAICQELDTLSIAYLTKLNEYSQQWKETGGQFQKGFLDLAHAKYTMGARTVSHFSYDERMKAILQVEIDDQSTMHTKTIAPPAKPKPAALDENKDGLRKRNVHEPEKKKNSEWVAVEEKPQDDKDHIELDEKKNKKKIKKSGDPLHWFGLFVSPSLRTSQEHFKSATEQLVDQVNRIRELQAMEKRYHQLQEEKLAIKLQETVLQPQEDVAA
ncbi:hypothetical protein MUCCIDRAFT_106275 [Mucor lusitanicus CBS 277.49]|uniref:Vacuolar ATPase assembly protein VMA22 n=3 Tax=Mucor circinelloides f. lusitanicus TaxID=29924 RepID=A0A168N390_MUCCL|nr:hypothetical protein MUCCIDRAFT_106275 [Mucor lusitanicus CBS 277.49]